MLNTFLMQCTVGNPWPAVIVCVAFFVLLGWLLK